MNGVETGLFPHRHHKAYDSALESKISTSTHARYLTCLQFLAGRFMFTFAGVFSHGSRVLAGRDFCARFGIVGRYIQPFATFDLRINQMQSATVIPRCIFFLLLGGIFLAG